MEMVAGAGTGASIRTAAGTGAGTTAWLTVLTTTDAPEKAEALARGAVEARAAACAQISGPVTSVYRWKGAVETASEWQVLFKTTGARYDALEAYLLAAHDYDTPEIIATPVVRGSADYLRWVEEETVEGETGE
ncbi:divalent-cation tolerance protein CutA [Streptomyces mirabilis]|uniref:divalent-cation tolerance protein CutA n=1 Tax=Streptomyces mirabilis TaxID=68239 RepID=UPI00368586CA